MGNLTASARAVLIAGLTLSLIVAPVAPGALALAEPEASPSPTSEPSPTPEPSVDPSPSPSSEPSPTAEPSPGASDAPPADSEPPADEPPADEAAEEEEGLPAPGPLLPIAEPTAVGSVAVDRLAGRDRFQTAIAIAQSGYPTGAQTVVLANGNDFPDALAAAPAAAALGAPLLLTHPTVLRSDVLGEIVRLAPKRVLIVGGAAVVNESVATQVRDLGITVERLSGDDRYATARAIIARAFPTATGVIVATGRGFADALVASAAAGSHRIPVVLVDGAAGAVDAATLSLLSKLGVQRAGLAGGTGVLSAGVAASLQQAGLTVTRYAGDDRYATALKINQAFFPSATRAFLASGVDFPDALAGAALAGAVRGPLYSVPATCIDESMLYDALSRLSVAQVTVLGGEGILAPEVAALSECAGYSLSERELIRKLDAQRAALPGRYSISVRELSGQEREISLDGTERKEPASVIKLFAAYAVLMRVDQGLLSLDTKTRSSVAVRDCLRTMIHISDNLCHADLLALLGNSTINSMLYRAGFTDTFYVGTDGTGQYQSAKKASTDDIADLLALLERDQLLQPASDALLSDLMSEQLWRSKIPSGIPAGIEFGNKTGQLWITTGLVEGDAGVVHAPTGTYSIAVLGDENAANWAIARLSRTVYEHLTASTITPASWGSVNLVTTVNANLRDAPGGAIVGLAPTGTRLIADSSNRVWYRVKLDGSWYWIHHTTVATQY